MDGCEMCYGILDKYCYCLLLFKPIILSFILITDLSSNMYSSEWNMGEALLPKLVRGDKFISVEEHEYRGRYDKINLQNGVKYLTLSRYVVSNKLLASGKVILKECAYATAVFDSMKQLACDTCCTTSDSPLKHFCEKCKKVWFCSPKCKMNAKLYPTNQKMRK